MAGTALEAMSAPSRAACVVRRIRVSLAGGKIGRVDSEGRTVSKQVAARDIVVVGARRCHPGRSVAPSSHRRPAGRRAPAAFAVSLERLETSPCHARAPNRLIQSPRRFTRSVSYTHLTL